MKVLDDQNNISGEIIGINMRIAPLETMIMGIGRIPTQCETSLASWDLSERSVIGDAHRAHKRLPQFKLIPLMLLAIVGIGCAGPQLPGSQSPTESICSRVVTANVVALEQAYTYNRFDTYNPAGMLFALRRDIVDSITDLPLSDVQISGIDPARGRVRLRSDKRPRPLVLRVNEGDCLRVTFTNLLSPAAPTYAHIVKNPATGDPFKIAAGNDVVALSPDLPFTRHASMHVNGLYYVGSIGSDGANVGMNSPSLAAPGETKIYTWYAKAEGTYFMYSMGTIGGGEGDGGQLGLGLFGAVNVEPPGSTWYRSQVSAPDMQRASNGRSTTIGTPILDYEPFRMVSASNEILHSDLNAVIDNAPLAYENGHPKTGARGEDCGADGKKLGPGSSCGKPFREFTVIFHDEITADQAFPELGIEESPLVVLKDNMAINYGAAGLGSLVLANRKGIGPSRKCKECKLEEFFLTSWVNGDPALVLAPIKDNVGNPIPLVENGRPVTDIDGNPQYRKRALYPDDPSNVHHSYVGDPVRFRNIHAGPKETHVFHLHAHQWVQDKHDPNSVYLDSQTISPGTAFNYEVHYGGAGNRNLGPGDSIFHCHLYPHFAQGMWALWRAHDVFEDGTPGLFDATKPIGSANHPGMRNLPDAEIAEGTPTPAVVPLPRQALPPMPTATFSGYPFYIAGKVGHRPPQPPNDFDSTSANGHINGGLPRHIISEATTKDEFEAAKDFVDSDPAAGIPKCPRTHESDLFEQSRRQSHCIAMRTHRLNSDPLLTSLARELVSAKIETLADFTQKEDAARQFHAGRLAIHGHSAEPTSTAFGWEAKAYPSCDAAGKCDNMIDPTTQDRVLMPVNGRGAKPGAPFGNPCPKEFDDDTRSRMYRGAYIQLDMTVNKQGWHDPQGRIAALEEDIGPTISRKRPAEPLFFRANSGDCVVFKSTNLVPSVLNLDDFQVFTPTDTIGQHIHLVKFDVTSSDGSGNGWNYEDGTFSPDEVRERLHAHNEYVKTHGGAPLTPKTHPMFASNGAMDGDPRGICPTSMDKQDWDRHPWCGAQTTVQRWWVDPLLNHEGEDRTIRTVFTHDHFGPSSHQQHGLYAALVVEPKGSAWRKLDGTPMGGSVQDGSPLKAIDHRHDGGPTSYAALIGPPDDPKQGAREYNLAVADFAIVYNEDNWPVNPDHRYEEVNPPSPRVRQMKPNPQGISPSDPGTALFNYRNEPIPLRIGKKEEKKQGDIFDARYEQKKDRGEKDNRSRCRSNTVENAQEEFEKARNEYPKPLSTEASKEIEQAQTYCDGDLAYAFSSVVHGDQPADPEFLFLEKSPSLGGSALTDTLMNGSVDTSTNISQPPLRTAGDPATPLLFAYQGERVNIRLIQGAQESQHVFNMHGLKWKTQPGSPRSGWTNAQQLGISEHFEFDMHLDKDETTDFLYASPEVGNLWHGAWGIMRGYKRGAKTGPNESRLEWDGLPRLHDSSTSRPSADSNDVCPRTLPNDTKHTVTVGAWLAKDILPAHKLIYNPSFQLADPNAILFVDMTKEAAAYQKVIDELRKQSEEKKPKEDWEKVLELLIEELGTSSPSGRTIRNEILEHVKVNHRSWPLQLMLMKSYETATRIPEPLILRAAVGDCLTVKLENHLPHELQDGSAVRESWSANEMPGLVQGFNFNQFNMSNRVSLHAALVEMNTRGQDGAAVGLNLDSTVAPGTFKTYEWFAGEFRKDDYGATKSVGLEFGAIPLRDMGDVIKHSSHGAIGALIIEPKGSTWELDPSTAASATVRYKDSNGAEQYFREFVLLYQDDVSLRLSGEPVVNRAGVDDVYDLGQKAFNYRTEPLWARLGLSPGVDLETLNQMDHTHALSSKVAHPGCPAPPCDPVTPFFIAKAGDPVRFRIVNPSGHSRQHGFTLHGHEWVLEPWECKEDKNGSCDSLVQAEPQSTTNRIGSSGGLGPARHVDILTTAGGPAKVPGDYLYRTQESFQFDSGLWGILCVFDEQDTQQCHNRSAEHHKRSVDHSKRFMQVP